MVDEENLISLAIFLSFCLSVHNTYVQPWLWGYVFFANIFVFFSHNFHFFREIFFFFFALFFLEIFALFFREIFAFSISRKFSLFSWANEMQKRSEMVARKKFREKFEIFEKDFSFLLETLRETHQNHGNYLPLDQ